VSLVANNQSATLATPAAANDSDRRLHIVGGLGGVLAAVAWSVQPILVAIASSAEGDEQPTLDDLMARPWSGAIEAVVFAGVGVGLLFLVIAVGALLTHRAGVASVAARVTHVLGVFAGCTWILLAGWYLGPYTSVGKFIAEAAPDEAVQRAVLHIHSVGIVGIVVAAVFGFAGWLLGVATVGRAHGIVGRPLAVVAVVAAAGAILPVLVVPFSPPFGVVAVPAYAMIIGIAFLLRARRAE
jgi:hypothetical protein